jgi:hypothetical protein
MNEELELKLQAWVDGELSSAEAERMAALVSEQLEAGQLTAELREVKMAMIGADIPRSVPESREFYWSKIERQIQLETRPAPVSKPGLMTRWRRFLMPLAGLAAASCVAVFTLTQSKPVTNDEFTSTDEAMDTTTFHDQSSGLTVVWLQDNDTARPSSVSLEQSDDAIVTD